MNKDTDILNVVLLVVSLFLAFQLPFELFLFSYAVLGPLHYVTEINWLREKNYFVRETKWIWLFVVLVAVITLPILLKLPLLSGLHDITWLHETSEFIKESYSYIILASLIFAIGLINFSKKLYLVLFLTASFAAAYVMIKYVPGIVIFANIFLPTIIHVYLFTMLFMIYGTMNSKSKPGVVAIVLLVLAPVIIALSSVRPSEYHIGDYTQHSFAAMGFGGIHRNLSEIFYPGTKDGFVYLSEIGIKIQIFVAFAYTYHYLNWFSKTTVIGWHKNLSRQKIIGVFVIWLMCISLYAYDYKTGMIALTFLSFSHIFLEFPLNIASVKGIWGKIRS